MLPSNLWWSADGREVLYTSPGRAQRDRAKHTVMALDIKDGTTRALFEPTEGFFGLHLAPDGRTMVHREQEGLSAQSLVVSELGAAEGRLVATSGELGEIHRPLGQPLFSPTGELLVYMGNHDFVTMSLWVVAPDGTGEHKIAEAPGGIGPAKWDPTIAYMAGHPDPSLEVVDVRTGETHEIEAFSKLGWRNLLDWSPDGRWLAVSETIGRSELWRISALLGEG